MIFPMTLNRLTRELEAAGIEDAAFEARLICARFTGVTEAKLLSEPDAELQGSDELALAVSRRLAREPLQYVLGEWEFMGLPFDVSDKCLIPRADTELLCETAMKYLPRGGRLLDLCTGSGCIAVSCAHYRPDAVVSALEKYPGALESAKKNAEKNGVSVGFIEADVNDPAAVTDEFDVIVSNPPYVTAEEMETLAPELSFEPREALTDGGDGLSFYRAITDIYPAHLKKGGMLAFEHGASQGAAVRAIIEDAGYTPTTLTDVEGRERVTLFGK